MNTKPTNSKKQTPARPLRSDFTAYTLNHARVAQKRAARWRKSPVHTPSIAPRKEAMIMKLIHKPILAILAVLVVAGVTGTAYAAANGGLSSITALFSGAKRLKDARIVSVEVKNCHDVNAFNVVGGTGDGHAVRYYKVQDSANISDEQVVALAQSICRASYNPEADKKIMDEVSQRPENKDLLRGNAKGTITALDGQTIALQVSDDTTRSRQPFTERMPVSPDLVVLDGSGIQKSISSLKVGDVIYSSYRATGDALTKSETTATDQVDGGQQVLVFAYKQTPDQAVYDKFQKLSNTKAIEQVAPCKTTDSGYCTFDELHR